MTESIPALLDRLKQVRDQQELAELTLRNLERKHAERRTGLDRLWRDVRPLIDELLGTDKYNRAICLVLRDVGHSTRSIGLAVGPTIVGLHAAGLFHVAPPGGLLMVVAWAAIEISRLGVTVLCDKYLSAAK